MYWFALKMYMTQKCVIVSRHGSEIKQSGQLNVIRRQIPAKPLEGKKESV